MKFNYDDNFETTIATINDALKSHGLAIGIDPKEQDGCIYAEIVKVGSESIQPITPRFKILRANYHSKGIVRDVTEKVKSYIKDNVLNVYVDNNNMGEDPLYGAEKKLAVVYQLNDDIKVKEVSEGETLTLP